jgi:hypothetical protein
MGRFEHMCRFVGDPLGVAAAKTQLVTHTPMTAEMLVPRRHAGHRANLNS